MARGVIQPDGTFKLSTDGKDGAVVSRHAVRVTCFDSQSPQGGGKTGGGEEAVLGRSLIPIKYTRCQSSGLEVERPTIMNRSRLICNELGFFG